MDEFVFAIPGIINQYWYNKNYVKYFLDQAKGKPVRVKVTSFGGEVAEAVAISNLFAENGNVTIEYIGFNASAATFMSFGAKSIEIHEDAMYLVHKCMTGVNIYGALNADQLELQIKELQNSKKSAEAIDLMIAKKYTDRCKKGIKDVMDLMGEDRWMSATEAKEWGFVDKVIPGINKKAKITDEIKNEFLAVGIPLPDINDETLADKIINGIRNILPKEKSENNVIENKAIMRTEFIYVNQVLNCSGLEEKDGKITLTVDQFKAINESIQTANGDKAKAEGDLKIANDGRATAETNYNNAVAALDGLSDDVKNATDVAAKVAVIKNVLDKVPGMKVVTPTPQNDGKTDFSDVAIDPINSFEQD
ncbi:MAG: Clp protease ClpP [Bacteroides sp.]|nr:Clp protease ClpP [Bacteroides sp.]